MTDYWEPSEDSAAEIDKRETSKPVNDTAAPAAALPTIVTRARLAVMISYFGLLGLFTGDALVTLLKSAPLAVVLVLWLFRVVPLLIFLPGLRQSNLRTHAWLSFAILMYFMHAVVTSFVPGELFYGVLYASLCAAVFISVIFYIRVARKYLGMKLLS